MRLTLDLLNQGGQSLSPSKHRQLTLRGFKIPAIENLGVTHDQYEAIDLGDNDIIKISNIPPLGRLKVLILVNNRISRIADDAFAGLPQLTSLVLTNNKLEKMADIEPVTKIKTLERLSLLDNPLTKIKHYRPYIIHKCEDKLRILDFNKVKVQDRKAAKVLFTGDRGEKLLAEVAPARTGVVTDSAAAAAKAPSTAAIERIKKAIAEAQTIEEVTRLEKALKSGVLPEDLADLSTEPKEEEPPAGMKRPAEESIDGEPVDAASSTAAASAKAPPTKKAKVMEWDSAKGKMVETEIDVPEGAPPAEKGEAKDEKASKPSD